MVGDSAIFSRPDNAAFDMTVHSAHRWNQVGARGQEAFGADEASGKPLFCRIRSAIVCHWSVFPFETHFCPTLTSPPYAPHLAFPLYLHEKEVQTDPHTYFFSLVGTRPDPPAKQEVIATFSASGRTGWVSSIWAWLATWDTGSKGLLTKLIYGALRRLQAWQVG